MATILSDIEIKRLLGTVIRNGDDSCLKANSYMLRLGSKGAFLNSKKNFFLDGKKKRGIRVQPGHSVGLTAYEEIDFRRDAVHKIYPKCDLHGFLSPSTDLSREGLMASTTQIDAGYTGTLNWTLTNSSNEERTFVLEEELFRLTIFRLYEGEELPGKLYDGRYHEKLGYVPSERKGPPRGMQKHQWEDSKAKGGPEEKLEDILNSGYPFNALGKKLIAVEDQFKEVTEEYEGIQSSIMKLEKSIKEDLKVQIPSLVRDEFKDQATTLQYQWMIGAGGLIGGTLGLTLPFFTIDKANLFLKSHICWISPLLVLVGIALVVFIIRKK